MKSLIGKEKLHLSLQISDGSIFSFYSLFLISFSSLRMRDDSCSGVGVLKESERPPSAPEGGVGSLCLKRSSILLCSLRFKPYTQTGKQNSNKHFTSL